MCQLAPPAFIRAVNFGVYDGAMRAAIHALKYDRIAPLARDLGALLAGAIAQLEPDAPADMLVVPVPMHRGRMAERGFNQARTLATEALRRLQTSHPAWRFELSASSLVRQRSTQSQAGLTPRQRRQNLRGAFFVSEPDAVRGRHILLVDDIFTTGATARACSKMLVESGAASVRVATLARAQRRFPLPLREPAQYIPVSMPDDAGDAAASSKTQTVH
jgi:ComF family protein